MKKQDWLDYFEAVNGRSPEPQEIEAALLAGEFTAEETSVEMPVNPEVSQAATQPEEDTTQSPIQQEQAASQELLQQEQAAQQEQVNQEATSIQNPANQQAQENVGQQQSNGQQAGSQQQQVHPLQVATPSPFVVFLKQFWTWFLAALKSPTKDSVSHKYNGLTAFGLLVFFTTLTISIPFIKFGAMTFSVFINIFIALAFIFFAFILGGFVVKRVVYKVETFTFGYSFEWFGRLLSPNIGLMALAAFCSLINLNSLAIIATSVSYFIFAAAAAYSLYNAENHSNLDLFHKYILASLLFGFIVILFIMLGMTIAGEILFNGLLGGFNSYDIYNIPFGY